MSKQNIKSAGIDPNSLDVYGAYEGSEFKGSLENQNLTQLLFDMDMKAACGGKQCPTPTICATQLTQSSSVPSTNITGDCSGFGHGFADQIHCTAGNAATCPDLFKAFMRQSKLSTWYQQNPKETLLFSKKVANIGQPLGGPITS